MAGVASAFLGAALAGLAVYLVLPFFLERGEPRLDGFRPIAREIVRRGDLL